MGEIIKEKLFIYSHTKDNIDYYKPNELFEIYTKAIDVITGKIDNKKIIEYTYHRNLNMYKVQDAKNRFETFWVSDNHSLIVYSNKQDRLLKISPIDVLKNIDDYYLIQDKDNNKIKIPCNELIIEYDENVKEAGDLTVEDYYTFCTHDGIFVQDTVAIYGLMSNEAQEEAKRKMISIQAGAGYNKSTREFSKDFILGLYVMTKDPIKDKDQ